MDPETIQSIAAELRWIKILIACLMVPVLFIAVIMYLQFSYSSCGTREGQRFVRKVMGLMAAGRFEEAKTLSLRRLEEKPDDVSGRYYSGMASFRKGDLAEAAAAFQALVDLEPGMREQLQPYLEKCQSQAGKAEP